MTEIQTISTAVVVLLQIACCSAQSDRNFVIYNPDRNKCLAENSLRLLTCNPDRITQQYRWTSENRIFNVGLKKCLGSGSLGAGAKLQWYTCNDKSNLQKWECPQDTLLSLKNQSLFLSVDRDNAELILSETTERNSRWIIHGTTDNLCSKAYEDTYSLGGNAFGSPCHFPFLFKKKWYSDCTRDGSSIHRLWCATQVNYHSNELWGYCPTRDTEFWKSNPLTGVYYQFNGQSALTWYQARKSCQQQDADLLSVTEPHEHTFVSGLSQDTVPMLWTGLNSLDASSGWRWSNGQPFRYLRWAPGEPKSVPGADCGALGAGNFDWQSDDCSKRFGYICQKTKLSKPSVSPKIHTGFCSNPWIPYSGHCYLLNRTKRTWLEAKTDCRKESGDLVSIIDIEEQSFVISQLGYLQSDELWTGLNDRRTQLLFEWSDQSNVAFTMWQGTEPSHHAFPQEDCVLLRGEEGKWADEVCDAKHGFICKKTAHSNAAKGDTVETNTGCKPGWIRHGYYCYITGSETQTYDDAKQACAKEDSHLVDIPNRIENAFLISVVGARPEKYFWIGLSNQLDRHHFKWTNTNSVPFTHFNTGMPGQRQGCVAMTTRRLAGLWDVLSCTSRQKYICKAQAAGLIPTAAPPTTPVLGCPEDWSPIPGRNFCFKFFTTSHEKRKSWFEALGFCRALGGDLLSIHSDVEIIAASTELRRSGWIGYSAQDPDAGYVWSDGSASSYENWGSGEPNNKNNLEKCVEMRHSYRTTGMWNDVHCEFPNYWFCQLAKGVTPQVPTITTVKEYNITSDGWYEFKGKQYSYSRNEYGMEDARALCKRKHADLVVINDEEERLFLWKRISSYGSPYIGLTVDLDKSFQWVDGSPVVFQAWEENQPAIKHDDEFCVVMTQAQGVWETRNCGNRNEFFCERSGSPAPNATLAPVPAPIGGCAPDWTKFQGKCYKIGLSEQSWANARSYCKALGGNLASITNAQQQAFLITKTDGVLVDLWLGLSRLGNRNLLWTDGSPKKFENWAQKQPTEYLEEYCVVMLSGHHSLSTVGTWQRTKCNDSKGFICGRPLDRFIVPAPTDMPQHVIKVRNDTLTLTLTNLTWGEARLHCEANGGHLVSIRDHMTQAHIALLTAQLKEPVWIGLNHMETDGYFRWIDNWHLGMAVWGWREPRQERPCVYADVDGKWKTALCNETLRSVCKKSADVAPTLPPVFPGKCPDLIPGVQAQWTPLRGSCYAFITLRQTWPEASMYCSRLGASLVSIEDTQEADFLRLKLEMIHDSYESVWSGLYKTHRGQWQWFDETVVDYINWAPGYPYRGDCADMSTRTAQWRSTPCTFSRQPSICKTAKVPLSTETSPHKVAPAQALGRSYAAMAVSMVLTVLAVSALAAFLYFKSSNRNSSPTFANPLYYNTESAQKDEAENQKLSDNMEVDE